MFFLLLLLLVLCCPVLCFLALPRMLTRLNQWPT